jgi:hypothetical protein
MASKSAMVSNSARTLFQAIDPFTPANGPNGRKFWGAGPATLPCHNLVVLTKGPLSKTRLAPSCKLAQRTTSEYSSTASLEIGEGHMGSAAISPARFASRLVERTHVVIWQVFGERLVLAPHSNAAC